MDTATPTRGHNPTPDWFEFHATGWICHHPHGPDDVTEELGHFATEVNSYALDHLDAYHPGWRIQCTRCGKRQWNAEESPRCVDCRRA